MNQSLALDGESERPTTETPVTKPAFIRNQAWKLGSPLAWATLVVSLMLTGLAFHSVRTDIYEDAAEKFDFRVSEILESIDRRMVAYTQTLQGGLGLLKVSDSVNRSEWRTYVKTLELDRLFPGIQGLGYAKWMQPQDVSAFEQSVRREGFPKFRIRPAGHRSHYTSIQFIEPFDRRNRAAFGYDMYSESSRRNAMALARDIGAVTISARVRLLQEINEDVQSGFLMYLPHYGKGGTPETADDRRRHLTGFVYAAFRMRDLMEGTTDLNIPNARLRIYDGDGRDPNALMYDSRRGMPIRDPLFSRSEPISIGQHHWTMKLTSQPEFEGQIDIQKAHVVLFAGVLTSLMFFSVLWAFATTRQRAQTLANQMTIALNEHSRELTRSNEELQQFAYVASHDLKAPLRGIDHLATWVEEDLGEKLDGEARENMSLLRGRIKRLEALLDDLLAFSRAGKVDAPVERVILEDFIPDVFALLDPEEKFELILEAEIATIRTRRSTLEQVFLNLFSNAIKHHDAESDGQVYVTVRESDEHYEFTIADNGPGIPPAHRERVFQMFQTLRPRDDVEGSGIGLAIIRKIIEQQGGKITIEDGSDGCGVLFRFSWMKIIEPNK